MTDLERLADRDAFAAESAETDPFDEADVAVPGSRLVLQFSGQAGPRYAIIASDTPPAQVPAPTGAPDDPLIVAPSSSLGRSLLGAHSGDLLRYAADEGELAVYVLTVHNSRPA